MNASRGVREIAILGPTIVRSNGIPVKLTAKERAVLTALALNHPRATSMHLVIDAVWPHTAPPSARQVVQNNISALRRRFGKAAIVTEEGTAYRLGPGWSLDTDRFRRHLHAAHRAASLSDHRAEVSHLCRALDTTRGEPFENLASGPLVDGRRASHHRLLLTTEEDTVTAQLEAGDIVTATAAASALTFAEPYRELRWGLLALALYRSGDRRGSLDALRRARTSLREGVGLDPGPRLVRLERMILDDDPRLSVGSSRAVLGLDAPTAVGPDLPLRSFAAAGQDIERLRAMCARVVDTNAALWITMTGDDAGEAVAFARHMLLEASLDGWTVLESRCNPRAHRILEPLDELARQAIDLLPDPAMVLDASVLDDLMALFDTGVDGEEPGDAAVAVMSQCAERSPTIVLIEEAHHLTTSALGYLERLPTQPVPLVVLAVGTPRGTPVPGGAEVIRLTNLGNNGTSGHEPSSARAPNAAPDDDPTEVSNVLTLLAVAGAPLSIEVMNSTGQFPRSVRNVLAAGVERGLLRQTSGGGFDVADAPIRDELAASVDADTRQDLHGALADALLADGQVFAAAPHLLQSSGDPELTITNVEAAADKAMRASMFVEAAALLGEAIDRCAAHHGTHDERTLRLMLDRADNLRRVGDSSYIDVIWDVVDRSEQAGLYTVYALAAAALCKLGPLTDAGAVDERVADVVADALARCEDATARALCAGEATLFFSMSGQVELCRTYFEESLELAREVGDDELLVSALGSAYLSLPHPSDLDRRADMATEMLAIAERIGDDDARFDALHFAFSMQLQRCDPMLRTAFARQDALAQRLGPGRRWMADYQRACLAYLDGRLEEAIEIVSTSGKDTPVSAQRMLTTYNVALFAVRAAQGRVEELRDAIDVAVAQHPGMPAWRTIAAYIAAERGDIDRVLHECDSIRNGSTLPFDMAWSGAAMLLGRAVARTGDLRRIRAVSEMIAPYSGTFTWIGSFTVGPFDLALSELALALGEIDTAERYAASLTRCIDRLGATVYLPDLRQIRSQIGV